MHCLSPFDSLCIALLHVMQHIHMLQLWHIADCMADSLHHF